MQRILAILWLAFKIWMIVDAVRRRVPFYWYLIIFFIPFGEFAYFFMVKYRSIPTAPRAPKTVTRAPTGTEGTVQELKRRYALTPSLGNKLALAQGLREDGKIHEAGNLFYEVLSSNDENPDALFGLGMCFVEDGRFEEAVDPLSRLVDLVPSYRDWSAWPNLAWALRETGRAEQEGAILRRLVKANPRLDHRIHLARYLVDNGERDEARAILEEAIRDHESSPDYLRRRNRAWAAQAIKNLSEL